MTFSFRPARRSEAKPLIGLYGESGTGKTWSGLLLARGFVGPQGRIGMIETEAGRGEAYADLLPGGYDVLSIRGEFSPKNFGDAITAAEAAKLDALIIDSASHEWSGAGGVLGMAAAAQEAGKKGPIVWQKPKMDHQRHFMLRLMQTPIPLVIVCMRAKYPMVEKVKPGGGKDWVRSETLDPDQAADILFEMFVHGWIDREHRLHVTKYTRPDLADIIRDNEPITIDTGRALAAWAKGGTPVPPRRDAADKEPAPVTLDKPTGAGSDSGDPLSDDPASDDVARYDRQLADAAERGTSVLVGAWNAVPGKIQPTLKAALDRRHKVRAREVDQAKTPAEAQS